MPLTTLQRPVLGLTGAVRSRRRPGAPATVTRALDRAVAAVFRAGSWARRAPVLHPRGTVLTATLDVAGTGSAPLGVPLLDRPARHRALVRLSKAAGTPGRAPDFVGLAVRVLTGDDPDEGRDLLLDSAGSGPLTRHLLAPTRDVAAAAYSTLLPYRARGRRVVVGALPTAHARRLPPSVRDLPDAVAAAGPVFDLAVAPLLGPWTRVARLALGPSAPGVDLAFDPDGRAPEGLVPAGWLQRLRGPAYRASQRGRAARTGRALA